MTDYSEALIFARDAIERASQACREKRWEDVVSQCQSAIWQLNVLTDYAIASYKARNEQK